jgi:galactokinase
MGSLRDRAVEAFRERFGRDPAIVARAPGRVNLLGGHVDYNEGWVLPAAIDRCVHVAAARAEAGGAPRGSDGSGGPHGPGAAGGARRRAPTRILALDFGAEAEFSVAELARAAAGSGVGRAAGGWEDYPAGVAWALCGAGHDLPEIEAAFTSDVPIGAGMSSSAAVEVAFLLVWEALAGLALDGRERARLARRAENEWVGVASGIMDQYASLHGKRAHLVFLDCRALEHELVPAPAGAAILLADSGVRRTLAGSDYNDRPRECREALAALRAYLPGIRALRDVTPEDLERHGDRLPAVLQRRAKHVVEECARVREGVAALRSGDCERFGGCIRRSHESSRDLYEVSIPELDALAEAAWAARGCHGARLVGAGSGGCVAAFVNREDAQSVGEEISRAFERRFGRRPPVFPCEISDGASVEWC